jgi:hypothetical protein
MIKFIYSFYITLRGAGQGGQVERIPERQLCFIIFIMLAPAARGVARAGVSGSRRGYLYNGDSRLDFDLWF